MNCWNIHPIPQIWLPLIAAVKGYFADLKENHYRDGIIALEHCWNKYICLKGDYVEK